MDELTEDKLQLIEELQALKQKQREKILASFDHLQPHITPFSQQLGFFRDTGLCRLLRCGNRAAKTYSAMRDLAWRITRTHPFNQKYNVCKLTAKWRDIVATPEWDEKYSKTPKRQFWIVGPTYEFVRDVMWDQYLKNFIPEWFIQDIKRTNQGNIDYVTFKNGDVLKCKTYSQEDMAKMGYAVDAIYIDEMPPNMRQINELIFRLLDKHGEICLAFTPLIENDEIKESLDGAVEKGQMSLHSWSLKDNPKFINNPEIMSRALEEFGKISDPAEREARISGQWYKKITEQKLLFEGVEPEIVEDFEIPLEWRRARVTDPAAHCTGHIEAAEDPDTGEWYCYRAVEINWNKKLAKAEDILTEINKTLPFPEFKFTLSLYDNAEAWFGAYAKQYGYRPCIQKNVELAIINTRNTLVAKRIKFFRRGAATFIEQIKEYKTNTQGTKVLKRKDHVIDCIHYFCRQIPEMLPKHLQETYDEKKELWQTYLRNKEAEEKREAKKDMQGLAKPQKYLAIQRRYVTLNYRGLR
jgi:hypothetical protein